MLRVRGNALSTSNQQSGDVTQPAGVTPCSGWAVDEFRANHGKVGRQHDGFLMVLFHHVSARSGIARSARWCDRQSATIPVGADQPALIADPILLDYQAMRWLPVRVVRVQPD